MLFVAFREFIYDLKCLFGGKKVIILLLYISYIVVICDKQDFSTNRIFVFYPIIYGYWYMRPKISKIQYLLPIESNNRMNYFLIKSSAFIVLNLIIFILSHIINVVYGSYDVINGLRIFFCENIPFFMSNIIFLDSNFAQAGNKQFYYGTGGKLGYAFALVAMIIPILHGTGLFSRLPSIWYAFITILAYTCAFYIVHYFIPILKKREVSYEKMRNPRKLWSL